MTGFLRSNRAVDSDVDDSFRVVMQYGGERRDLIVTGKTAVVTPMMDQLKFFVRSTGGFYVKVGSKQCDFIYFPFSHAPKTRFLPVIYSLSC